MALVFRFIMYIVAYRAVSRQRLSKPVPASTVTITEYFFSLWGGVRLGPLVTATTSGLLYQPRMIDDECGAVGGMIIGRGNRSTRIKPAPVPLCLPQIPYDLAWARNRASALGRRRLTA
jgi:hypothetical protein